MKSKDIVVISILTSLALVISLIENYIYIPVLFPGAKLGLSNIVILFTIVIYGFKKSIILVLLKCLSVLLLSGNFISFLFSISGGIFSCLMMNFAYKKLANIFGYVGISVIGSFFHNLGQVLTAMIIMSSPEMIRYLYILNLIGLFSGTFVGIMSYTLVERLKFIRSI